MDRECARCGRELAADNPSKVCFVCADKLNDEATDLPDVLDVEDVSKMLHVDAETVRRKHQKGELPECIPGQKKLLWLKDYMMAFLEGRSLPAAAAEQLRAVSIALELGWPIDQMTLYGHDPGNLITELKKRGYLQGGKGQSQ